MVSMGQTITVVNKSGKIVSNASSIICLENQVHQTNKIVLQSKHIVNVFKEAKAAYLEKKAELRQTREAELPAKPKIDSRDRRPHHAESEREPRLEGRSRRPRVDDDDVRSVNSHRSAQSYASHGSRRSSHSHASRSSKRPHGSSSHRHHGHGHGHRSHTERPGMERGYSDSIRDPGDAAYSLPRRPSAKPISTSPLQRSFTTADLDRQELSRRKSESDGMNMMQIRRKPVPSRDVDMDLAYGELPPPLAVTRTADTEELRGKMTALQRMLEEANCLQHSATAIIKNLESNPEAMAAVALTLAEISNLASKLAPGALMSLKGAFPAVVALLVSPEFLIAAGLGVGVTVIAFGSYKIIKKIRAKKAIKDADGKVKEMRIEDEMVADGDELESIHTDIDRIEQWRRGIAIPAQDADAATADKQSTNTSVEGEFMTPGAASQLRDEGVVPPKQDKSKKSTKAKSKSEKKKGGEAGKKKSIFSRREKEVVGDFL